MIIDLGGLVVRHVTLRHKTLVEERVEVVPVEGGDPVLSLTPDDAILLSLMLRRRAEQVR